jgi:hypothetical protein
MAVSSWSILWIAAAWTAWVKCDEMWDEEDGFCYDLLRLPDGSLNGSVRSMVGLPLCVVRVSQAILDKLTPFNARHLVYQAFNWCQYPRISVDISMTFLSLLNETKLRRCWRHWTSEFWPRHQTLALSPGSTICVQAR